MAVTIYDVAKRARVGISTVSRAINDSPNIKPETKKRVQKAIRELGYSPHTMAKRLAGKRIGILTAIMPFYTGYFYQELLRGIQQTLTKYEYDLLLHWVDKPETVYAYLERTLGEKRSDGLLIISMEVENSYIERFVNADVPLVLVDRAHKMVDGIAVDNERAARIATEHLLKLGHKKIALISGAQSSKPAQERQTGFKTAIISAGLDLQDQIIISSDSLDKTDAIRFNDGFNEVVGYAATQHLILDPEKRPTAIFASADVLALGAMRAVKDAGLRVPEDVAIIGFDDIELASYLSLTTMHQPMFEMGQLAAERLIDRIKDNNKKEALKITLDARLVIRQSTKKTQRRT